MLFVLLVSVLTQNLILSPEMLASPFVILSITGIFNSYNNLKSADDIYLSGFYMSLASLMYALAIDVALHLHRVYDYEVIYGSRTNATPGGMVTLIFVVCNRVLYWQSYILALYSLQTRLWSVWCAGKKRLAFPGLLVLIGLFVVVFGYWPILVITWVKVIAAQNGSAFCIGSCYLRVSLPLLSNM